MKQEEKPGVKVNYLTEEIKAEIDRILQRKNTAIVKYERQGVVVLEESRKIMYKGA